ncbi:MAG: class I tRNA ligase family protein, partial [Patescibacteria group bacterium]
MIEELSTAYDPKATENRIYKKWEESGCFQPRENGKSYAVHLPPPNITGSLHMGHALNATITDILIRYHRMKGEQVVWFPGIDHAGIATQNVVEKQLRKENVSRWDLGRAKFIEKVWEWKEKYGNIILDQLKKIGASCDWSRTRFTMDAEYAKW